MANESEFKTVKFGDFKLTRQYPTVTSKNNGAACSRVLAEQAMRVQSTDLTATTERVLANTTVVVTPELFKKLQPPLEQWRQHAITCNPNQPLQNRQAPLDEGSFWRNFLNEIKIGRSALRWLQGKITPPCVSFHAKYSDTSPLGEIFNTQCVNHNREFNGRKYRVRPDGVGFYYGPKGSAKKEAFKTNTTSPVNSTTLDNMCKRSGHPINLEFKFACTQYNNNGQQYLKRIDLFYGQHPELQFILNIHIQTSTDAIISNEEQFQQAIGDQIKPFNSIINKHLLLQPANNNPLQHTLWDNTATPKSFKPSKTQKKQVLENPNPLEVTSTSHPPK